MRMQAAIKCTGLIAILVLLCVLTSQAQVSTATITGVVQDASGAVIPNAEITATQTATNLTVKAASGGDGIFNLRSLPVGPYTLSVKAAGFAPYTQTGIVLTVGQVANLTLSMKVGGDEQKVEVSADAAAVQTTESSIQSIVPEAIVSDIPLNGRNPATIIFTVPGVTDAVLNVPVGSTIANLDPVKSADHSLPGASAPTSHGVKAGGTYFSLDGASNIDPFTVLGANFPNPDATQEFNVVTGTYGARYVSAPGGSVNIITKSGTNNIHGSAFEYLRNGFFNAQNPILKKPDILHRHQFGGAVGAPIVKNRLFAFASYQRTMQTDATTKSFAVPTTAQRNGTFICTNPFGGCGLAHNIATGQQVQIPAPMLSTVARNLLSHIPLPDDEATGQLTFGVPSRLHDDQFVIKSDLNLGSHRLFGRYFFDHYNRPAIAAQATNIFTATQGQISNWNSLAFGDTWAKGQWVLDSRFVYNDAVIDNLQDKADQALSMTALGAQNFTVPSFGGTPLFGVDPMVISTPTPSHFPRKSWVFSEDAAVIWGKHQLSFGANYTRTRYTENNASGQQGVFIYPVGLTSGILFGGTVPDGQGGQQPLPNGISPGNIADFMLGAPLIAIQSDGWLVSTAANLPGMYFEDKYRVTPKLTMTAGMRWDPYLPYVPDRNQMDCWIPGQQSKVFVNAPIGVNYPGDPGCSSGGTRRKLNNFQPRIGLAWDPTGSGKMSIRAGYGMYSMQLPLTSFNGLSTPPWINSITLQGPFHFIDNLWNSAGMANPFADGFHDISYKPATDAAFPSVKLNIGAIAPDFKPGYVQQWSLSVQRALTDSDTIDVAYVGTKGTHLGASYDANLAEYVPGLCGGVACSSTDSNNINSRRPYQSVAQVAMLGSGANSSYNGLDLSYTHRMKWGLYVSSAFTWSKCLDDTSGAPPTTQSIAILGNDLSLRHGRCDFDQNYVSRTTFNWDMPKFKNAAPVVRAIVGNWSTSGLLTLDAGQPFSVASPSDNSMSGQSSYADLTGAPIYVNGKLNSAAFTQNAAGTYGNSGRNSFRAPGYRNFDLSLTKNIPVNERFKILFRSEAFNLFNHTNYLPPQASLNNTLLFGTYNLARDPRIMQFSLKAMF